MNYPRLCRLFGTIRSFFAKCHKMTVQNLAEKQFLKQINNYCTPEFNGNKLGNRLLSKPFVRAHTTDSRI